MIQPKKSATGQNTKEKNNNTKPIVIISGTIHKMAILVMILMVEKRPNTKTIKGNVISVAPVVCAHDSRNAKKFGTNENTFEK